MITDEYDDITVAGLPGTAVAGAAREVFLTVLCQPISPASEQVLERWMGCLEIVQAVCEQELMLKWSDLTRRMAYQFYGSDRWDELPEGQRVAWEAAARTLVNWCSVQEAEDRKELERFDWKTWAIGRLTKEPT